MRVHQALFTSSDRGPIKGYQVAATSAELDRELMQALHRWSPSQIASDKPDDWTINYAPLTDHYVAVSRTVLGGPEYSSRGGIQVVTAIAVIENRQFAVYQNNAVLIARTALALGWLRLPDAGVPDHLEPIRLPDTPIFPASLNRHERPAIEDNSDRTSNSLPEWEPGDELLREATLMVQQGRRVAIIGAAQPRETAEKLIARIPAESRREVSFTSGLPPSTHRPFRVHFLRECDSRVEHSLRSEGVTPLRASVPV